jgi:hypothetical protein
MYTIAEFKPDEVFKYVPVGVEKKWDDRKRVEFVIPDGRIFKVKVGSIRLVLFKENPSCVCCGITGSVVLLQRNTEEENPHFNFYAVENDEIKGYSVLTKQILMTKDHIQPVSKGGSNDLKNLQTMCENCNGLKGGWPITNEQLVEIKKLYLSLRNEGKPHKEAFYVIEEVKKQMCKRNEQTYIIGNRIS